MTTTCAAQLHARHVFSSEAGLAFEALQQGRTSGLKYKDLSALLHKADRVELIHYTQHTGHVPSVAEAHVLPFPEQLNRRVTSALQHHAPTAAIKRELIREIQGVFHAKSIHIHPDEDQLPVEAHAAARRGRSASDSALHLQLDELPSGNGAADTSSHTMMSQSVQLQSQQPTIEHSRDLFVRTCAAAGLYATKLMMYRSSYFFQNADV